jgi:hypothetical protein
MIRQGKARDAQPSRFEHREETLGMGDARCRDDRDLL